MIRTAARTVGFPKYENRDVHVYLYIYLPIKFHAIIVLHMVGEAT